MNLIIWSLLIGLLSQEAVAPNPLEIGPVFQHPRVMLHYRQSFTSPSIDPRLTGQR